MALQLRHLYKRYKRWRRIRKLKKAYALEYEALHGKRLGFTPTIHIYERANQHGYYDFATDSWTLPEDKESDE